MKHLERTTLTWSFLGIHEIKDDFTLDISSLLLLALEFLISLSFLSRLLVFRMHFPRTSHLTCAHTRTHTHASRAVFKCLLCTAPTLLLYRAHDSGPQRGDHVHMHDYHLVIRMKEGLDQQQRRSVASVPKKMIHSRAMYDDCTVSTFLSGVRSWITISFSF